MRTCVNLHSAGIKFAAGTASFLREGLDFPHKKPFGVRQGSSVLHSPTTGDPSSRAATAGIIKKSPASCLPDIRLVERTSVGAP